MFLQEKRKIRKENKQGQIIYTHIMMWCYLSIETDVHDFRLFTTDKDFKK